MTHKKHIDLSITITLYRYTSIKMYRGFRSISKLRMHLHHFFFPLPSVQDLTTDYGHCSFVKIVVTKKTYQPFKILFLIKDLRTNFDTIRSSGE